ncbi:MAG TPA: hypothetical protein P5509_10685 [Bacteroidales bacterium]|jgi:uncharacterized Zn finger protein|nr:hypothetical protein [Bacteroidales bacterium]
MQQPQMRIDLSQATDVKCAECGNIYFQEVMVIKKVSKLLAATDKDQVYPIPVLQCAKCGHVNEEFIPKVKKTV